MDVAGIKCMSFGFEIADAEAGDVFIDKEGDIMFMTVDAHTINEDDEEYWREEDGDMPIGTEVRVAYRLSDGECYYYAEHESIQRILEFAKITEGK